MFMYIVIFIVGYAVGVMHLLYKFVDLHTIQTKLSVSTRSDEVCLELEKHGSMYYAYLDNNFIGQDTKLSLLLPGLFDQIFQKSKSSNVVIGESIRKLSEQEQRELADAVSSYVNKK